MTATFTALDELDSAITRVRNFWYRPEIRARFRERLVHPLEAGLFRTLRAIEDADDADVSVGDVASALAVDASTASRFVERAIAEGCVERAVCAHDRRRSQLSLTSRGQDLLTELRDVRLGILAEVVRDWSSQDVARLAELLDRLDRDAEGTTP